MSAARRDITRTRRPGATRNQAAGRVVSFLPALRNEVMIYSIIDVPIEASAGRDLGGEHALITLAEQTGGKYFYVEDGGLYKAFARVSDDLRTQYLLGYYPQHQEPGRDFHRIVVTIPHTADGQFNVRNKTGYYADSAAPSRRNPVD